LTALEDPPRAADLPSGDATMLAVARHHRLAPLLSLVCAQTLPGPLADAFRHDRVLTAARNMILGRVAEECVRALTEAEVPAIVLKGLDYEARLYRAAGVRPTADVDLLVPAGERRRAFLVLDRLGFEPRACAPGFDDPDYHEVAWTRSGVEVDLHIALAPFARGRIDYAAIWSDARKFRLGDTDALSLSDVHASIFHALHMGIDHFAVPAIYLVDLARLLADPATLLGAEATARTWQCHGPFVTALALTQALLPRSMPAPGSESLPPWTRRVVVSYGALATPPRAEQLLRKFAHFDTVGTALRYFLVQSRRNVGEILERRIRKRSARQRLGL
jgi:Uncharacterised nucleotidyltransferase